jgi:cell division protein FtsX
VPPRPFLSSALIIVLWIEVFLVLIFLLVLFVTPPAEEK